MSVFTELSDADQVVIAEAYAIGSLSSVIGIANGDTETTYLFRAGEGEFIVTLFENGAEPLDLEQAFETMDNLYDNGVPCPKPRRTTGGQATMRAADRLVAVVSFLPGSPTRQANVEQCESLGRVMAQIHTTLAPKSRRKAARLPTGPIHGALDHDNIFFLNNVVCGVINFRLRHNDVLVAEIADVLIGWSLQASGDVDTTRARAILSGYQTIRSLTDAEKAVLSGYVLASAAKHYAGSGQIEQLPERALSAYSSMTMDITN
ncbi:phosphotransferase (plasmid) [Agrobacterium fabrum]|uniref:phosphotransferase n=1 Tax=Agrobacterium fabrum TaxID=1176649 RepID=UPI0021D35A98|nr:phosphotransferase [Agrobacterium fabrum]UXT61231.1 phosphotransferase [Agrobacterium fabrum]